MGAKKNTIAIDGELFRDAIVKGHGSLQSFAELVGRSKSYITHLAQGVALPSEQEVNLYCKLLGVEPDNIIIKEEEKKSEVPAPAAETSQTAKTVVNQIVLTDEQFNWIKSAYSQLRRDEELRHDAMMNAFQRLQKVNVDMFNLMKYGRTN